ncbi:hypothetical protein L9F63_024594, partial [Diploptera punctata]
SLDKKFDRLIHFTEQFTWEDLPTKDPDTGETTMAGWINKTQVIVKRVHIVCMTFHLIQTSYRIASQHAMVFNSWYPFDITVSPTYEFLVVAQFIASHVCLCTFTGTISLYAVIVSVACSQLEKLRISILNLRPNKNLQDQITECILHHQRILEQVRGTRSTKKLYMNEIEKSLNMFFCVQLLVLFIGICLVAFSAVTAESIREAAWECEWVGTPTSFQKTVMFIIARSNKEFNLTAGKFAHLSNKTLLK